MPAKGTHLSESAKMLLQVRNTKYHIVPEQKFGSWTAIRPAGTVYGQRRWICRCVCGQEKTVAVTHLINKNSTQCVACAGKELSKRRYCNRYAKGGTRVQWVERKMRELWDLQKGICPICVEPLSENLSECAWDHNHKTGEGRRLLHRGCNVFIGFIENHPGVVERSQEYLHA